MCSVIGMLMIGIRGVLFLNGIKFHLFPQKRKKKEKEKKEAIHNKFNVMHWHHFNMVGSLENKR